MVLGRLLAVKHGLVVLESYDCSSKILAPHSGQYFMPAAVFAPQFEQRLFTSSWLWEDSATGKYWSFFLLLVNDITSAATQPITVQPRRPFSRNTPSLPLMFLTSEIIVGKKYRGKRNIPISKGPGGGIASGGDVKNSIAYETSIIKSSWICILVALLNYTI
jgi:hypothetical protein